MCLNMKRSLEVDVVVVKACNPGIDEEGDLFTIMGILLVTNTSMNWLLDLGIQRRNIKSGEAGKIPYHTIVISSL